MQHGVRAEKKIHTHRKISAARLHFPNHMTEISHSHKTYDEAYLAFQTMTNLAFQKRSNQVFSIFIRKKMQRSFKVFSKLL